MSTTLQASHELIALDLLQVNIDEMPLDELEAHVARISDTLLGLAGRLIDALHMSPVAASNIRSRERDLRARLPEVRELIDLRKAEAAETERRERERDRETEELAGQGARRRL